MAWASLAANTASTPGRFRQRHDTAGRVAIQDQPSRRFGAKRRKGVVKSAPAPRGARIVAADERKTVAALRHEMPRHRNAGLVIVEPGDRVDRCQPEAPRSPTIGIPARRNSRAPSSVAGEPTMMIASGRRDSNAESM